MLDELVDTPVAEWRGYDLNHKPVRGGLVVTDKEIEAAAESEWLETLSGMWDAIGKPTDEKRLVKYAKALRGIPLGLLEKAIDRAVKNAGDYQVVPTISAIWAAVRKELGNPYDVDVAIERWCEAKYQACVVRFE